MIEGKVKNLQASTRPGQTRLLIVDDDPDILSSLKDILELEIGDCSIDLAIDVNGAKTLAQQSKPDLALLDIKLGQDNGLELVPALRRISPDIACVMMTAYRDNEYTVSAVRVGAKDYIYKPIEPIKLVQTIERLLHQQRLKQEIATERKKAEEEIKALNATLEERVKQRTLELEQTILLLEQENEQRRKAESLLKQAKVQAEQANQAKSEFLSRMSHELRTPMNAILGYCQLLQQDEQEPLTPFQAESIGEVLTAGHHLLELINEVLDIAKIESGKHDPVMEPVNLNEALQACLSLLKPLRTKQNILIETKPIIPGDWNVMTDPKYLKQSLLNIISNAIKYNREGGKVSISCQNTTPGRLRISVSDTGCGISSDKQGLLFQPFERLGKQYEVEGTGIGLAVTKRLVEAMNGSIGFESTEGQGSTFWIELDLAGTQQKPS